MCHLSKSPNQSCLGDQEDVIVSSEHSKNSQIGLQHTYGVCGVNCRKLLAKELAVQPLQHCIAIWSKEHGAIGSACFDILGKERQIKL